MKVVALCPELTPTIVARSQSPPCTQACARAHARRVAARAPDRTVVQIWSASRHPLATNRTSTSISVSARVHQAQQLQVLSTN